MDFQSLPKVELHLHLDCSLSYAVVSHLAPSITEEEYLEDFIAPAKCLNLADCLTRPLRAVSLMQTEEALRLSPITHWSRCPKYRGPGSD
jgi:adenosine deaminase